VKAQAGSFQVANTRDNEEAFLIFLRLWREDTGKQLHSFKQLAQGFGYPSSGEAKKYWKEFQEQGGELLRYLQGKGEGDLEVERCD